MTNFINLRKSKKLVLIQIGILILMPILLIIINVKGGLVARYNFSEDLLIPLFAFPFVIFSILLLVLSLFQFKKHTFKAVSIFHTVAAFILLLSAVLSTLLFEGLVIVVLYLLYALITALFSLIFLFDSYNIPYEGTSNFYNYAETFNIRRNKAVVKKIWHRITNEKTRDYLKSKWKIAKFRRTVIAVVGILLITTVLNSFNGGSESSVSGNSKGEIPSYVVSAIKSDFSIRRNSDNYFKFVRIVKAKKIMDNPNDNSELWQGSYEMQIIATGQKTKEGFSVHARAW